MQYDTIEELTLELSLYPNRKKEILEDCAKPCQYGWYKHGWFAVAKDGNCALFDDNGELNDISQIKNLTKDMLPDKIERINIPDGIEILNENLFEYSAYDLLEVHIPASVVMICSRAFFTCYELQSITIPDSVVAIKHSAFAMCHNLRDIKLPSRIKSIEVCLFQQCYSLKSIEIPENVMFIDSSAFVDCTSLEEVILPAKIGHISYNAFINTHNLHKVIFKGKTLDQVKAIENYPWGIEDKSIIRCEK